jgi:hypothetical protein
MISNSCLRYDNLYKRNGGKVMKVYSIPGKQDVTWNNKVKAIIDTKDIQTLIGEDIFPAFVKNGIKYFITINSKVSALTKMTVKKYSAKVEPNGLKLVELNSVEDAIIWLENQK